MEDKRKIKAAETLLEEKTEDTPVDWETIARAVEYWIRTYPQEAQIFSDQIKDVRKHLKDPVYAKAKNRRWACSVPERLHKIIFAFEPYYDTEQNIYTFLERFPMFKVPEKL